MYTPAAFEMNGTDEVAAFVAAHPFATLVVNGAEGPLAAHLPVLAQQDEAGRITHFIAHVARSNPMAATGEASGLLIFRGADAYVSPGFYPTKAVDPRHVPTWNYVAVEARGRVTLEADPARMRPFVEALTSVFEAPMPMPWSLNDAPPDYLDRMYAAIVGIRFEVTDISGKQKLSQNRKPEDRYGVQTAHAASPDPAARALAAQMNQTKP
jgi:transcriptional regulator